jgi:hypothetical protein
MKGTLQELCIEANLDELKAEGAKEFAVLLVILSTIVTFKS